MSGKKREYNPVLNNVQNICLSLAEAVEYLRDKFPHSPDMEDFYQEYRWLEVPEDMHGFIFTNGKSATKKELLDFILETKANGFPFLEKFFINEFRNGTRDGVYTDPERAKKIYSDLAVWGCFGAEPDSQKPLPIQQSVNGYLSLKNLVKKDPVPIPETYKSVCRFKFDEDMEDLGGYLRNYVEAIVATTKARGEQDDLKFLFYDYDWKTSTGYIEILSTRNFDDLLSYVCENSKYRISGQLPKPAERPAKPVVFAPSRGPLKRK